MVYLMRSVAEPMPGSDAAAAKKRTKAPVKWEALEQSAGEDGGGQLNKRFKLISDNEFHIPPSQYNPLDEPSPLGLRLRKSPSLLDLIQMRLSQTNASSASSAPIITQNLGDMKDVKSSTASATTDKHKASNFPAVLLRIGNWEYLSKFEGDLVAKCYFAKHKLVWEILENGLKSKIEIQWSDITALKANFPDDGPGTLSVTLARPPHFYKESNPQPRKHTLWQASADFTDGQASTHRQHVLQCPLGVLNKHYEKLIQCDMHLNRVSRQPDIMDSHCFEKRSSFFKNPNAPPVQEVDQLDTAERSPISGLQYVASPSSSLNFDEQNSIGITLEHVSPEAPSPSSENGSKGEDGFEAQGNWEQLNALGMHKSMSMSDLVNHIGHCISERMASGNSPCSNEALEHHDMLENIAQVLLSDTHLTTTSDEKKLMSRVNSLCCLLQDPNTAPNMDSETQFDGLIENDKRPLGMPRMDSFGDLLLSLPRIASLPKFLFDISEDDGNQAK